MSETSTRTEIEPKNPTVGLAYIAAVAKDYNISEISVAVRPSFILEVYATLGKKVPDDAVHSVEISDVVINMINEDDVNGYEEDK